MARAARVARLYLVNGIVQGVGFRHFVYKEAKALQLDGYVRNRDDGQVEVFAMGTEAKLSELAGRLWRGPRWAHVRGVEEREAALLQYEGFHITG